MSEETLIHPEMEEIIALAEGACDETQALQLRDHLADCSECTQLFLDFRSFEEGEMTAEVAALSDEEVQADFQKVVGAVSLLVPNQPFYQRLSFAYSLAAVFLIGCILLLGNYIKNPKSDVYDHHVPVVLHNSDDLTRGTNLQKVEAPADTFLTFTLGSKSFRNGYAYVLQLKNISGKVVKSYSLTASKGNLYPSISSNELKNGDYVIDVYTASDLQEHITYFEFAYKEIK